MDIRRLLGWIIGVIGASIAATLLAVTIAVPGIMVPKNLDKVPDATPAVKVEIASSCLPVTQVTKETQEKIKQVTNQDLVPCDFRMIAFHQDALWGALAFAAVALLGFWMFVLARSSHSVATVLLVVCTFAALAVGVFMGDSIKELFTARDLIWIIFWHGFFAALAFSVSGVVAYVTYD